MNDTDPTGLSNVVKQVLTSHVYDIAIESPIEKANKLSQLMSCSVYLKREDMQPVHSFKLRGAYNKMSYLSVEQRKSGVIAASAGNHAQGVALSAKKLGVSALIVMPRTTPAIKIDAVRSYGAEVELVGDNYSEAYEFCKTRIKQTGRIFVHPFDDLLVIAGQGTIGREITEQLPGTTHIFVPVGGGGMLAGIAAYVKALRPDIKIIAVEPQDSNAMQASIKANKRITLDHVGIFADGVAVKQVGTNTFKIARDTVDDFITVNTDQICAATKAIFEDTRSIVEPAGALSVAGIMQYKLPKNAKVVAICSGANVTFERLQQIAERTLIGSNKEALFACTIPEKPGALQTFCQNIIQNRNITEFSYRLNSYDEAHILIGIGISDKNDHTRLCASLNKLHYKYKDLSGDDIAKEHIRYMIGGCAKQDGSNEEFYQIDFPERPGALVDFLSALDNHWNISLFHYRSTASDTGRVLIGFEANNQKELEKSLSKTNFSFARANNSPSIKAFIR